MPVSGSVDNRCRFRADIQLPVGLLWQREDGVSVWAASLQWIHRRSTKGRFGIFIQTRSS